MGLGTGVVGVEEREANTIDLTETMKSGRLGARRKVDVIPMLHKKFADNYKNIPDQTCPSDKHTIVQRVDTTNPTQN